MKRKLFVIPVFIAFLGVGYLAYALNSSSSAPPQRNVVAAPPSSDLYSCKAPAINTYKFCDQLPAGYQIAPRLPNAPQAFCPTGTSDSTCLILKQTQSNGVCDPNETVWSDPLDCGCTGALIADPFTGRCGSPATVCQLQAQEQAAKQQG